MGIFSKKGENIAGAGISGDVRIPMPPSRKIDDVGMPFRMNPSISQQNSSGNSRDSGGTMTLSPTSLSPGNNVEIGLPPFATKENYGINLDEIERQLSITQTEKEDKKEEIPDVKEDAPSYKEVMYVFSKMDFDDVEKKMREIQTVSPKLKETTIKEPEEIPDEIDDVPEFVPGLSIEQSVSFERELSDIQETDDTKPRFISLGSITKIQEDSNEVKLKIDYLLGDASLFSENSKKESEIVEKAKNGFEDIERKILFINKTIFSEE